MPLVSVVMPVHNGERYLRPAIDSILNQTLAEFEFIIVDDGSTDRTPDFLRAISDSRIRAHRNDRNEGFAAALNRGLHAARGQYVARMDADDIALPERFSEQVSFLESHPDVGILGTAAQAIDAEGRPGRMIRRPCDDLAIRWTIHLGSPFIHPSVMLRGDIVRDRKLLYDGQSQWVEDYEFWPRVLAVSQGANLPGILMQYREHEESMTRSHRTSTIRNHDKIACGLFQKTFGENAPDPYGVTALRRMFIGRADDEPEPQGAERLRVAEQYIDLMRRFLALHARNPQVNNLRRDEVRRVASAVFARSLFAPGWLTLTARLAGMDPSIIFWLMSGAMKRAREKLMSGSSYMSTP